MISINGSFVSTDKLTDLSVVSVCSLGVSRAGLLATDGSMFAATGLQGSIAAGRVGLPGLPVRNGNERPSGALAAGVAAAEAKAYAFAAVSAESEKQSTQHHTMWAFRGPEPWSDPA